MHEYYTIPKDEGAIGGESTSISSTGSSSFLTSCSGFCSTSENRYFRLKEFLYTNIPFSIIVSFISLGSWTSGCSCFG